MATRESIFDEYRDAILEGMARTLWVYAYADWIEEIGAKSADELGMARARAGEDWDKIAPETPKAAMKAAKELVELYESGKANGPDIVELYGMAQTADMEEDFEFTSDNALPLIKSDTKERAEHMDHSWKISNAEEFGSKLASMALRHGTSWFDNHKAFEMDRPNFECHYDGEDLNWSGGTSDVREVSGKLGRITVVNHDDASWTKHSYVLAFGGFTIATPQLLLIYANSLQDAFDEMIDWVAENEPDSLANEQVAEEYQLLVDGGMDEQDAIDQAEADTLRGGNASDLIHAEDWHMVAEDPSEEDLLKIAKRPNPGEKCSTAYHKTLKDDDAKWKTLELKGYQRFDADEQGPQEVYEHRDCDRCPSTLTKKIEENPAGLTAKGERMYEDIKRSYQRRGDPRAKEIASRTVLARAKDVPGLRTRNPRSVLPVPGQWISWNEFDENDDLVQTGGTLVRLCEESDDGEHTAYVAMEDGRERRIKLDRTEYDLGPRYKLERRTNPTHNSRRDERVSPKGREGTEMFVQFRAPNVDGVLSKAEYRRALVIGPAPAKDGHQRTRIQWMSGPDTGKIASIRSSKLRYDRDPSLERKTNPTHAEHMKQRAKAEAVLEARRRAGFEGGCDDPNCRGWDVFEQDNDPLHGAGIGIQACDMCNAEAKRQGLPVLHDSDAKHLAAAEKALQRARRGA